jgi:hypothetical protein
MAAIEKSKGKRQKSKSKRERQTNGLKAIFDPCFLSFAF